MASKAFFSIEQGADLDKVIFRVRTTFGANVDMSSYAGACSIKTHYNSNTSISLNASFDANGDVRVFANSQVTASIKPGRYVYDVIGVSGNTIVRVVEGYVSVDPAVTIP